MNFSVIPCLKNFHLNDENVCNLCQKKIRVTSEIADQENSPEQEICIKTSFKNIDQAYFSAPLRRFAVALLLVFGPGLFTMDAQTAETLASLSQKEISLTKDNPQVINKIEVYGTITDQTGEPLPFVTFQFYDGETVVGQGYTDWDGHIQTNFTINENCSGLTLKLRSAGFQDWEKRFSLTTNLKDNQLQLGNIQLAEIEDHFIIGLYIDLDQPKLDPYNTGTTIIKRKDIKHSPYRN